MFIVAYHKLYTVEYTFYEVHANTSIHSEVYYWDRHEDVSENEQKSKKYGSHAAPPTHIRYQCTKFDDDRTSLNVILDVYDV